MKKALSQISSKTALTIVGMTAGLILLNASGTAQAQKLTGAGATFPNPIYAKWFSEYSAAHPGVEINYQSIGSGGGIRQVTSGLVDFGASDIIMTDEQIGGSKVKLVALPTVLGAVVPIFNVTGVSDLKFSPDVLADIFLGKITTWNDARIAKDNPGVKLPSEAIHPIHRSEGSGTTFIFSDYLTKVSKDWANGPGKGSALNWPTGVAGKGNEGVASFVRQLQGSIGYVELIYGHAEPHHLWRTEERFGQLGEGIGCRCHRGCRQHQADASRLPRFHHQCSWRGFLSHLQLHLAAGPGKISRPGQGQSPQGLPQLDAEFGRERSLRSLLRSAAQVAGR